MLIFVVVALLFVLAAVIDAARVRKRIQQIRARYRTVEEPPAEYLGNSHCHHLHVGYERVCCRCGEKESVNAGR